MRSFFLILLGAIFRLVFGLVLDISRLRVGILFLRFGSIIKAKYFFGLFRRRVGYIPI